MTNTQSDIEWLARLGLNIDSDALIGDERRVPLASITEARVGRGWLSHHPAIQAGIGLAALAGAGVCASALLRILQQEQVFSLAFAFGAISLLVTGGWTFWDASRRGPYLALTTDRSTLKLTLPIDPTTEEQAVLIDRVLRHARAARAAPR